MRKATIIDYGAGNILSVKRAFEYYDTEVLVTHSPEDVLKAEILVLPGVGAFADGMKGLRDQNLVEPIQQYSKKGLPFLGICLGMQMMMDESEEFGIHQGLGLVPGKVVMIDDTRTDGVPHKVPHVGWNELCIPQGKDSSWWDKTILDGIAEKEEVYFVHSFTAFPENNEHRLADTYYGSRQLSAVIKRDNLYGCQFHPEKSGQVGLRIIRDFIEFSKK